LKHALVADPPTPVAVHAGASAAAYVGPAAQGKERRGLARSPPANSAATGRAGPLRPFPSNATANHLPLAQPPARG
jgi:hypothetical protein